MAMVANDITQVFISILADFRGKSGTENELSTHLMDQFANSLCIPINSACSYRIELEH